MQYWQLYERISTEDSGIFEANCKEVLKQNSKSIGAFDSFSDNLNGSQLQRRWQASLDKQDSEKF